MIKTKAEKRWLSDVASLSCICCRNMGLGESPAEIHHIRHGNGMSQRASHFDVIPLCPPHHRGTAHPEIPSIHLDKVRFEQEFGKERELLAQTVREVELLRANLTGGSQ